MIVDPRLRRPAGPNSRWNHAYAFAANGSILRKPGIRGAADGEKGKCERIYVNSGKLRALGVSGAKRSATMPNVPTIAESGLPGYQFGAWQVLVAPKGTPHAIIALLNDTVVKALRGTDLTQRFSKLGWDALPSSPAQTSSFLQSEQVKWGRVVRERGMRAD